MELLFFIMTKIWKIYSSKSSIYIYNENFFDLREQRIGLFYIFAP